MEIDWFTFIAQIANFLVLVWLLKRFLYKPVVRAMDEREQKIADRLADAARAREDAERDAAEYRRKTEELEHAKEELLAEAGREIEAWKAQRRDEAKQEVDAARQEWDRALQREKNAFLRDLRRRAGEHVFQIARRVLDKLGNASLEERIVDSFLERLQAVHESKRAEIAEAIRNARHRVVVKSAFELPDGLRSRVLDESRKSLGDGVDVEFKVDPEVVCGIELQAAGFKVAWSAGETLDEMEADFEQALNEAPMANVGG